MSEKKKSQASGTDLPDVSADQLDDLLLGTYLKKDMASVTDLDDDLAHGMMQIEVIFRSIYILL